MNILVISDYYYPKIGGITEHVHNQVKILKQRGHKVILLTPMPILTSKSKIKSLDKSLLEDSVMRFGYAIPVLSNGSVAQIGITPFFKRKIRKIVKDNNIDIIHIHSPLFGYYGLSTIKYIRDIPIVGTFHTFFKKSFLFDAFQNLLLKYFNALDGKIAVSSSARELLKQYFNEDIRVINNGIDLEYFSTDEKIERFTDSKVNVFFIGRPEPRNGIDILIKAFSIAKAEFSSLRLIIAGGGAGMETYKKLAKKQDKEIAKDIVFVGSLTNERPAYYSTADIHVFPVEIATFSITVLEGMAASKPVITTDIAGMREILGNENNGILVKYGDYKTLAKEILRLARNKELRELYGRNARERVKEFSWDKVIDKVENYYKELVK